MWIKSQIFGHKYFKTIIYLLKVGINKQYDGLNVSVDVQKFMAKGRQKTF